jgi:translation initiation factor IF-1
MNFSSFMGTPKSKVKLLYKDGALPSLSIHVKTDKTQYELSRIYVRMRRHAMVMTAGDPCLPEH